MSYIRLSDLAQLPESAGMGQSGPEQYDAAAASLEQQAQGFRSMASGLANDPNTAGQAAGLNAQADAMAAQAAQLRQKADDARSAGNTKAILDITSGILTAGATVGAAAIAADAARRASKQPTPTAPMGSFNFPVQQPSTGLSTGAMVGIGVGILALLGVAAVVATRKD